MKKIIAVLLSFVLFTGALTSCRFGRKIRETDNVIFLEGDYDPDPEVCYFEESGLNLFGYMRLLA